MMMNRNNPASRLAMPYFLKVFAVIRMIIVYLMEVFASPQIYHSQVGVLLTFLATPPTGTLLIMHIMGYFTAIAVKRGTDEIYRGLKLIVWGCLLNLSANFHRLLKIALGRCVSSSYI